MNQKTFYAPVGTHGAGMYIRADSVEEAIAKIKAEWMMFHGKEVDVSECYEVQTLKRV